MTTERMGVIAVLRAYDRQHGEPVDFGEAIDAVVELVRTVDRVAYALTQDGRTSDGISKEAASNRLRAALAPFSEAGR